MATYTVTNTFVADTTAVASEVNQNFTDVLAALNSFDASNLGSGTVPLARISGLTTTQFAANVVDTDGTLSANSDTRLSSQKAIKTYTDAAPAAQMTPTSYAGGESTTLPNGMIMKMGFTSIGAASGTVTFGVPFPTTIVAVTSMLREDSTATTDSVTLLGAPTVNGFPWGCPNSVREGFYWIAVGY